MSNPEIIVIFAQTIEDRTDALERYVPHYGKPEYDEFFEHTAKHQRFQDGTDQFCSRPLADSGSVLVFKRS